MADAVEIRITASNGASQVFKAIEGDADRLARSLTEAGTDGDRAFEKVERGAKEASRELITAERNARSFGDRIQGAANFVDDFAIGITALGTALVYSGQQAMEEERQIIALRAAFGDAADEMLRFAEELDAITIFSDQDIRAGEQYFAGLRNEYGLTIDQIQELMQVTADLASARGLSFENTSSRVTSAIRGETEASEILGLSLQQNAIDREGLTLTMSNQEAAQFRLNALNEQAAIYQGTAQEIAESSIGTYAEMTDTVQDWAAAAGSFIGPWGSVISGLGLGLAGVTSLVGGLGRMTGALRTSTVAATALGTSLKASPYIAAFTAGAAAAYALSESFEEGETIASRFGDALDELESGDALSFLRVLAVGADEATTQLTGLNGAIISLIEEGRYQIAQGNEDAGTYIAALGREIETVQDVAEAYLNSAQLRTDAVHLSYQNGKTVAENEAMLREEYETTGEEIRVYREALDALALGYLDPSINAEALHQKQRQLYYDFYEGNLTVDEHRLALTELAREYGLLPDEVDAATASIKGAGEALRSVFGDLQIGDGASTLTDQIKETVETAEEAREALEALFIETAIGVGEGLLGDVEELNAGMEELHVAAEESFAAMGASAVSAADDVEVLAESLMKIMESGTGGGLASIEEMNQATRDFIASGRELAGWDDALSTINMTSLANDTSLLAENVGIANDALDTTFRIIVGNTNAMGQQAQAAEDWALELIGVAGEYAKIDDLLASGAINLETYNQAQQAQVEISAANAAIQEDILAIQAQQAPLIADLTTQQAAYIDTLSGLPEQQQLIALGWMDANTAAQANEAVMLAAAAANDEFGASGQAAVQGFIEGAVAANPVLEALLTDIGLVARDHEGNLIIDFAGAEGAKSEIAMLTESIDALIATLGGIPPIHVEADVEAARAGIEGVTAGLRAIDGTGAYVTVYGDGSQATTALTGVDALRADLDGSNALVSVFGDNSDAQSDISTTRSSLAATNGMSALIRILGDNSGAMGAINEVSAYNGANLGTAVFNVVTQYSSVGSAAGSFFANGGTVWADDPAPTGRWGGLAAANGRTVMVGEAGPELVTLPHGSQVMPHAASMSRAESGGGGDIHVHFDGVFYGSSREVMDDWATHDFIPTLSRALDDRRRALGVR